MSVVARAPDGTIRIYCKGSDTKVMARIRDDTDPDLVAKTNQNLHLFAKQVRGGMPGAYGTTTSA